VLTVSRIGRLPVVLPAGVSVRQEGNHVAIKGPKGELSQEFHPNMKITLDGATLHVARPNDTGPNKALHGLTRALLNNMVLGVTNGFEKRLEINGVGYRADAEGDKAVLQVGFSHPVKITPPPGIAFRIEQNGHILVVTGIDKQVVGEVAAIIRDVQPPEPYKGKGIAYTGEKIRRKAGKAGKGGAK
jgi:large subunit ribosomal protein L6